MTGTEHYAEAERLLEQAGEVGARVGAESCAAIAIMAQVHATLALAAATAATTMAAEYGPAWGYGASAPQVYGYDGSPL